MLELENKCAIPTFLMPPLFGFLGDCKRKDFLLLPITSASRIAIMGKAQMHKVKIIKKQICRIWDGFIFNYFRLGLSLSKAIDFIYDELYHKSLF